MRSRLALAILILFQAPFAGAHTMMMTQVLVSFGQPGTVDVKIDIDLTLLLGSAEHYYEVATESPQSQQEDIRRIVPKIASSFQLFAGQKRLELAFPGVPRGKSAEGGLS
jgi:hypothetical protein